VHSAQGVSPQFPVVCGARRVLDTRYSIAPPAFAIHKCPQMSSQRAHPTRQGRGSSVVRWVLSLVVLSTPPRATPRLGGVYVSCQYPPCSFVLALLRELGLRPSVGGQRPTPAPRQLPWGPAPRGPERTARFIGFSSSIVSRGSLQLEPPKRDWEFRSAGGAQC
jgi:hypothetical protein